MLDAGTESAPVRTAVAVFVGLVLISAAFVGTAAAQPAPDCSAVSHDLTADGDYAVTNLDELQCMGTSTNTSLNDSFVLTQDIETTETSSWNNGSGFEPIGNDSTPFDGTFDGSRYVISDLFIDRGSEDFVGLFGDIGSDGVVENVGNEDVNITGRSVVGGISGANSGTVANSYVTGDLTGNVNQLGGIVGGIGGTVERSYGVVNLTGDMRVGGIAGQGGSGTIRNSYAIGYAEGSTKHIGGIIGSIGSTEIVESYAAVDVNGPQTVGGLVGFDYRGNGRAENSYWDVPASGTTFTYYHGIGLGDISDTPPADEMTGNDAKDNMDGFDFENTWSTVTGDEEAVTVPEGYQLAQEESEQGYPILEWQVEEGVGDCLDRRSVGRGQEDQTCPSDREISRGESRDELDRGTDGGRGMSRRDRGRGSRGR